MVGKYKQKQLECKELKSMSCHNLKGQPCRNEISHVYLTFNKRNECHIL